jgi:hypothetical protein
LYQKTILTKYCQLKRETFLIIRLVMNMFKKNKLMSLTNLVKLLVVIEMARFTMEEIKMMLKMKDKIMMKLKQKNCHCSINGEDDA